MRDEDCDCDTRTIGDFSILLLRLTEKSIYLRGRSLMCKTLDKSEFIEVRAGRAEDVVGEQFYSDMSFVSRLQHSIGAETKIKQLDVLESRK
jgi:hypothetical protein